MDSLLKLLKLLNLPNLPINANKLPIRFPRSEFFKEDTIKRSPPQ